MPVAALVVTVPLFVTVMAPLIAILPANERFAVERIVWAALIVRIPVFVIDPAHGFGPPREAFLPTEMDFAITGLWSVSRPGPWMTLYDLR